MSDYPLLVILGATAAGKTKLAVHIAQQLDAEIISADSRQIFRGMDIGTGKDLMEYKLDGQNIPYHLINVKDAGEKYNVNEFKSDFYSAFGQINKLGKLPILCGGTGMYIHSVLQNYELTAVPIDLEVRTKLQSLSKPELIEQLNNYPEELRSTADYSSSKRLIRAIEIAEYLKFNTLAEQHWPQLNAVVIGLQSEVHIRRKRIIERLDQRLNNGLIEEVQRLIANGVDKETLIFYGLEYKFVVAYLNGELNFETFRERLGIAICQFAKRQQTFFRKMEKDGVKIHWLDADEDFLSLKDKAIRIAKYEFDSK